MTKETKQILAFIFKRSGKKTLPSSDVYLAMSMELQWCSPKEAKILVKNALKAQLLKEDDQGVTPSFEIDEVFIPTGFSPTKECFLDFSKKKEEEAKKDLISIVIKRVINKKDITETEIKQAINYLANEKQLTQEVATLFFAKKNECKIQDLIPLVKKSLFTSEGKKA